jgi:O-antigen/teichoic acid export membrane protein
MDMGLGLALIQRKEVDDNHYGSVFFFNIMVGAFLALVLFFCSTPLAKFYHREIIGQLAKVMSLLFVLNSFGNVLRIKLRKELDYGIPTQANLLAAVFSGAIGIIMAIKGFGVWSLVIQGLLNPLINNVYLFYRIHWRPKLIFKIKALQELWSFGFRMFISMLLDTVFSNLDSIIIGKLFSPATLGYFYRAKSLNNLIIQYSSSSLTSVLFPVISKLQAERDRLKDIIFRTFHLLNFITFFLVGLFYVTGQDIIIILFSSKWQPAIPLFKLLIISGYAYPLSAILVNIVGGLGNSRNLLKLEIIKKVFFGINLSVGFFFGIKGYLYGYTFVCAVSVCANVFLAANELSVSIKWFLSIIFPYLVIALIGDIMVLVIERFLHVNHIFDLFLASFIFIGCYGGLNKLFNLIGMKLLFNEIQKYHLFEEIRHRMNLFITRG